MTENKSFTEKMQQTLENSILDLLRKGDWLKIDYNNRIEVPLSLLRDAYKQIDFNRVLELIKCKLEEKVAETIINNMMQETATDVKKILSNNELREDLRSVLRAKIRECNTLTNLVKDK